MLHLLLILIVAIVIVIVLFVALEYFERALGGNARLWLLLKGLIVLAALLVVLQLTGVLDATRG